MGSLGISKEMIVRAKFKDYIATLGDKADDFVKGMVDAAGDALQAKIDEADQLYDSIKSSVENIASTIGGSAAKAVASMETVNTSVSTTVTGTAGPYPVTGAGSGAGTGATTSTNGAKASLSGTVDGMNSAITMTQSSVKQLLGLVTQMSMQDVAGGLVSGLDSVLSGASSALQAAKALLG